MISPENFTLKDKRVITLRSATVDDAQEMVGYFREIFASSEYFITEPSEYHASVERQRSWIASFDKEESFLCLVAEHEGKIIGNLDFKSRIGRRRIAHRGDLCMGVLQQWRNHGVGRLLLERLIRWAKDEVDVVEKLELATLVENKQAIKLYKSLGFKKEGIIKGEVKLIDGRYLDGIVMGKWVK